jgi:hypothetical protein
MARARARARAISMEIARMELMYWLMEVRTDKFIVLVLSISKLITIAWMVVRVEITGVIGAV